MTAVLHKAHTPGSLQVSDSPIALPVQVKVSMPNLRRLASVAVILLGALPVLAQESHYVYDPLGQLIGVVDPQGLTTIYEYDEVGNLLVVRRAQTTGPVAITLVSPNIGPA